MPDRVAADQVARHTADSDIRCHVSILLSTTQASTASEWLGYVVLIAIVAGVGVWPAMHRVSARRDHHRMAALRALPAADDYADHREQPPPSDPPADRSVRGYLRAIRNGPGYSLRVMSLVALTAAAVTRSGLQDAILTLGGALMLAFAISYPYWRRNGDPW